jgi:membrane-associated protease RseP (regulator of RpoE activity)
MPLPNMDGGLFRLSLIEKIKGSRSACACSGHTVDRLVLIVGIFLIVTIKDIVNW